MLALIARSFSLFHLLLVLLYIMLLAQKKHKTPLFLTCRFGCGFWCWTCCGVRGAVIKFIDLLDVYFTKALPLTYGSPLFLWNDRRKSIPSEGVFSIVHYGSIIVRKVQGICVSMIVFLKVKLLI